MKARFINHLQSNKLMADGAFGTYYQNQYGGEVSESQANWEMPERVVEIHRQYLQAGARVLRTNTFSSNTISLECDLQRVQDNIKASVALAREAILQEGLVDASGELEAHVQENQLVYLLGDIGPIRGQDYLQQDETIEEYVAIGKAFLDAGVELLVFESFDQLHGILPAIRRIKEYKDCFVLVQFSVNQFGYSNAGLSARSLWKDAMESPLCDGVGLNCGVGPGHMEQILSKLPMKGDKIISVMPNAGYPRLVQNRLTFKDNIAYFTEKLGDMAELGVNLLGGCCGTNPSYIKDLAENINLAHDKRQTYVKQETIKEIKVVDDFITQGIAKGKPMLAVELAPPLSDQDDKLLEAAHLLRGMEVDVVTFPDSPSGRTRADSILMAAKVRKETGLRVMPHLCCRDKNGIAMRSQVLGAKVNDIQDFLIVTGDPVPMNLRQNTKSVFNFDSVGLMKILQGMNEELFQEEQLCYGGAINHNRLNMEIEINRVRKKQEAGASFFMTQPVFTLEEVERLRRLQQETNAVIFVGLMPLVSLKNALFMKNEMPGIVVSDEIIARYEKATTKEEGEACGVRIARDMMEATKDFAKGYYFSFPFNRVYLLKNILAP